MNKEEKKIPGLITNEEYLTQLFNQRIKDIDTQATKVLHLKSYIIKDHFDDVFFHYVIQNNITLETNQGLRRRYRVFCVSFSGHERKKMYEVLELIYQHGFNKGDILVPRPLWYINKLMSAFYVGIPGDNLLEHIKYNNINYKNIKKIAKGLLKLHQIKTPTDLKLPKHKFSTNYLDPTNIIDNESNTKTDLSHQIKKQFKQLKDLHKKIITSQPALSHGDFHPENVIINQFNARQVALIDFSETCLAPVYYDISSFLQQLEFMTRSYINQSTYHKIEKTFLTTYFNEILIDQALQNKINLYKSWTALKSTVYFMIFEDDINRSFAEHLLKRSKEFCEQIKL